MFQGDYVCADGFSCVLHVLSLCDIFYFVANCVWSRTSNGSFSYCDHSSVM